MTSTIVSKICCTCKQNLPETDFAFKDKRHTVRHSKCRECTRAYIREHYRKNKEQYLERNRRTQKRNRAKIHELKKQPCTDCGQAFPTFVMEFDHRDPSTKSYSIGRTSDLKWFSRLVKELDKCDLVCANCHKIRTHTRRYGDSSLNP